MRERESFGNGRWLPDVDTIKGGLEFDLVPLVSVFDHVARAIAAEETSVDHRWDRRTEDTVGASQLGEDLAEESYGLRQQKQWATLLHVVAVYHSLEFAIGVLCRWMLPTPKTKADEDKRNADLRALHVWKALKKHFRDSCGFELTSINGYDQVNLLRMYTNAVKHTGSNVSGELATALAVPATDSHGLPIPIDHTRINLNALRTAALTFVEDLVERSEAAFQKKRGKPPSG